MINKKRLTIFLVIIGMLILSISYAYGDNNHFRKLYDIVMQNEKFDDGNVVAIVDGQSIYKEHITRNLEMAAVLGIQTDFDQQLNELVRQKVLESYAKSEGISIADKEVVEYQDSLKSNAVDADGNYFDDYIAFINKFGVTEEQFYEMNFDQHKWLLLEEKIMDYLLVNELNLTVAELRDMSPDESLEIEERLNTLKNNIVQDYESSDKIHIKQ